MWVFLSPMKFGSGLATCLASLTVALVPSAPAAAQDFRGGIRGTVVDSTGGVLPGVTVTVTNAATGIAQTVVTDDKGLFEVLYLNGGTLHAQGRALRLQESRPRATTRSASATCSAVDSRCRPAACKRPSR